MHFVFSQKIIIENVCPKTHILQVHAAILLLNHFLNEKNCTTE
jgi:hypothetical protein